MRAKHLNNCFWGYFMLRIYFVTSVYTGNRHSAMLVTERNSHTNHGVSIYYMTRIHQAVVAPGTTDLQGKDSLIGINFDYIKTLAGFIYNIFNFGNFNIRKVMAVN